MVVLALDTSGRVGSVAVLRGDDLLVERAGNPDVPHGRRLPGDLLEALDAAGVALADVDLYAVASGPGAFTGLRIGIATVQGLAFAHGRRVAAVSSLDALAHTARYHVAPGTLVAAWMDAARGDVFSALYTVRDGDRRIETMDAAAVDAPEATLKRWSTVLASRPPVFVGEGATTYRQRIDAVLGYPARVLVPVPPLAAAIGRLAIVAEAEGHAGPPHAVRPLYVRRPDAELARDGRTPERARLS
jgi:tRNA threonylcarbamoyladenosine biosynthesis protein TsaB